MKNIMVCVDLKEQSITPYKEFLNQLNTSEVKQIFFVTGFQRQIYADNFYFTTFPTKDEDEKIINEINMFLKEFSLQVLPPALGLEIKTKCLISSSPKQAVAEFSKEKNISDAVIVTRSLHGVEGLFASSFSEYMLRHTNCSLTILRSR